MSIITETIYAGRNNTFSLQLVRAGEPINLLSITGYELVLPGETAAEDIVFKNLDLANDDKGYFVEKPDGIVEITIGDDLTVDQVGRYKAYLVTYDPVNPLGVRWPYFYLKVL
ncbi:MAG TPA: hypothetical protein VM783_14085 [Candidatus Acidoferrum sp.]|nr:hypothetical protein [Candidatus Acidoferrum sp.]